MAKFFEWFDTTAAELRADPRCEALVSNNFDVQHTGGGCLVWSREVGEAEDGCVDSIWILAWDSEGASDMCADPCAPVWMAGRHRDDEWLEVGGCTLLQAIAVGNRLHTMPVDRLTGNTLTRDEFRARLRQGGER